MNIDNIKCDYKNDTFNIYLTNEEYNSIIKNGNHKLNICLVSEQTRNNKDNINKRLNRIENKINKLTKKLIK